MENMKKKPVQDACTNWTEYLTNKSEVLIITNFLAENRLPDKSSEVQLSQCLVKHISNDYQESGPGFSVHSQSFSYVLRDNLKGLGLE
jgi:hypothetical protein